MTEKENKETDDNVIIIPDMDDKVIEHLKLRAERNGRSFNDEILHILDVYSRIELDKLDEDPTNDESP